jgi:hypothetical protein
VGDPIFPGWITTEIGQSFATETGAFMSKQVYRQVLELERLALQDDMCRAKSCSDHASPDGYVRCMQKLRALEHRRDVVDKRLHALDSETDGFWGNIKFNLRWVAAEFADGFERWTEQVEARQSLSHEPPIHRR